MAISGTLNTSTISSSTSPSTNQQILNEELLSYQREASTSMKTKLCVLSRRSTTATLSQSLSSSRGEPRSSKVTSTLLSPVPSRQCHRVSGLKEMMRFHQKSISKVSTRVKSLQKSHLPTPRRPKLPLLRKYHHPQRKNQSP